MAVSQNQIRISQMIFWMLLAKIIKKVLNLYLGTYFDRLKWDEWASKRAKSAKSDILIRLGPFALANQIGCCISPNCSSTTYVLLHFIYYFLTPYFSTWNYCLFFSVSRVVVAPQEVKQPPTEKTIWDMLMSSLLLSYL